MSGEKLIGGKYEIQRRAGKGGAGEVFCVYDRRLEKRWAAKRVAGSCPGMEALALGKVRADCFPRIVDVVEGTDCRYLIMDWIEGETLQERIGRDGAMEPEEAVRLGIALCEALGSLHRMQPPLLYLDCKPSNIIIDPDGKPWFVDFGSALENAEAEVEPISGSFGYAAPEQFGICGGAKREHRADARSDVYGLGRTLYALLSGMDPAKPPYGACPLRDCNPAVSAQLEKLIEKCIRVRPAERFQTMEAVKNALEALETDKRAVILQGAARIGGTALLLGASLWNAWIFYRRLGEAAVSRKLWPFVWLVLFAVLAHLWRQLWVGRESRLPYWEPEPLQSVMRTEKKAGRWLFTILLCMLLPLTAQGKETELLPESVSEQMSVQVSEKLPVILRDVKLRKLLVKEGCALESDAPVFLELDPALFEKGQELEICVTASTGKDDSVWEYRFFYLPQ